MLHLKIIIITLFPHKNILKLFPFLQNAPTNGTKRKDGQRGTDLLRWRHHDSFFFCFIYFLVRGRRFHSRWINTKRPSMKRTAYCARTRQTRYKVSRSPTSSWPQSGQTYFELGVVVHEDGDDSNVWHEPGEKTTADSAPTA